MGNMEWGGDILYKSKLFSDEVTSTPLQFSYRAVCSNNQHRLRLQTSYCTSVITMLIDMPANQVIIIAVTDGYTRFLSVAVSISLPVRLLCAQDDDQRGKTGGLKFSRHGADRLG